MDNLRKEIRENRLVLNRSFPETVQLDFAELDTDKLEIDVGENEAVSLLLLVDSTEKKLLFRVHKNARLSLNLASFDTADGNRIIVELEEGSSFEGAYADFSRGQNRFALTCDLNGRNSSASWHLSSAARNEDSKVFTIDFYHKNPDTFARMDNYGVCEDQASLDFLGTSKIEEGARGSATHQKAKIMVFDPKCRAKASPCLCIDENDVQASHAAVVGQINEDHIFYLTSRGIPEKEAKKLITLGYLLPILDHFGDETIKAQIRERIEGGI